MPDGAGSASVMIAVGRVRRSHGVRGVLVVEALTPQPETVFSVGRRFFVGTSRGEPVHPLRELHVEWVEPFMGGFRVQFEEIRGKDEADLWRDRQVLLPRDEVPPPGEDEILLEDLIGLHVVRENGDTVGTVSAYYELPHDLLIEVTRDSGDTVLIPYREEFVSLVDLETKRVIVDPPEGLL